MAAREAAEAWTDEEFHANLARVVHLLLMFRKVTPDELADRMGKGRSTIYGKLKTGKFTAVEVRKIAEILRIRVEAFYQPADGLFSDALMEWYAKSPDQTIEPPAPELGVVPPTSSFEQMQMAYPANGGVPIVSISVARGFT